MKRKKTLLAVIAAALLLTGARWSDFVTSVLLDKGGAVYNIRAYGAKCDDTTDDHTAIQAATDAALAGHGIVEFSGCSNKCRIGSAITVDTAVMYITFHGNAAAGACVLAPLNSYPSGALLDVGNDSTLDERITIDGMSFSGRQPDVTDLTVPLVKFRNIAQFSVKNSSFSQSNSSTGALSIVKANGQVGDISHNVFGSTILVGLYMDQVADMRVAINHFIEGRSGGGAGSHAIDVNRGGPGLVFTGNIVNDFEGSGILIGAFASNTDGPATLTGNDISNVGVNCISVADDAGTVITGNKCYHPKTGAGVAISIGSTDMTVTGNFVSWPEGQCIIDAGSETTISGNTLRNCKTAGIDLNGATGVEASGNRIYDGGAIMTYGIRERNAANDNRLGPNKITNAGAANYLIIGSTTVVDDRSWSVLQGDLPTVIGDGSGIYCSTCTANNSTCAGAGSGAFANRINGGWDCR